MRNRKSYWRRWGVRKSNPHRLCFHLKDVEAMLRELWKEHRVQGVMVVPTGLDWGAIKALSEYAISEEEFLLRIPVSSTPRPDWGSTEDYSDAFSL